MARLFDDAVPQYGRNAGAVISGYPLTMAGWFNTNDVSNPTTVLSISTTTSANHYHWLALMGSVGGDPVRYAVRGTSERIADSTTGFSVNTWHHACGVGTNATDRAAFIDGGSKGTNAGNMTPSGMDTTTIGVRDDDTINRGMSGLIAEAAVWDVALTDAEVAILGAGLSPLFVRPSSLVAYWPIIGRYSPEIDVVGGFNLTLTGPPTVADHPRIILPSRSIIAAAPAAVVAAPSTEVRQVYPPATAGVLGGARSPLGPDV